MCKVLIMFSIFQGMPRKIPGSYTFVAGFLICQYTFQCTSCILCVTGGILGGMWKVCIRNFTLVAGFLICQYTFQSRENEVKEHILVPYDNLFQSILSFPQLYLV